MDNSLVRQPKQKRSIEKKEKIIKAGFDLFRQNGYEQTNIKGIARLAGVSVGTLYSYFPNKKHIYVASYEYYMDSFADSMFHKLGEWRAENGIEELIELWIEYFLEMYAVTSSEFKELEALMLSDDEMMKYFCDYDTEQCRTIEEMLVENGYARDNLAEKIYMCYILMDNLCLEKYVYRHSHICFSKYRQEVSDSMKQLFAGSG